MLHVHLLSQLQTLQRQFKDFYKIQVVICNAKSTSGHRVNIKYLIQANIW